MGTRAVDRRKAVPAVLLGLAGLGWWWSIHTAGSMSESTAGMGPMAATMSFGGFLVAWVAMMAAMMFPAILPAVRLFDRAAARDQAAATPVFVAGYLAVWSAVGTPVFFAWRALAGPLVRGDGWVAYLAGGVLVASAAYQVSPLKLACLEHCRSPLSFFLRQKHDLKRASGALRAGTAHGVICLGCCWAEMAVLIALGTMNIGWMLAVAAVIFVEKVTRVGRVAPPVTAIVMAVVAAALFVHPHLLRTLT